MSRRNSKRWVYLIGSPVIRPVKIGVSNEPEARLEDLQTGSPVPLHLLWKTPGGQALESALHAYFEPYRSHGEWFDFGEENPAALVATAAVLLGYRAQPERVPGELRYQRSDCASCAGRRVAEVIAVPPAVRLLPVLPAQAQAPDPVDGALTDNQRAVLAAVRDGAVANRNISMATGLNAGSVARTVDALVKRGLLAKDGTAIRLAGEAAATVVRSENVRRVLDAVKAMPLPVRQKDIVGAVGLSAGTVSKTVKRLIQAGFLVRNEDGSLTPLQTTQETPV